MKLFFRFLILLLIGFSSANAAPIIRDAEIEQVLRTISDPIFKAANIQPASIKIYIVNENQINAYVSGGKNIFINTGLLGLSEKPGLLTGVIAHETGHISGGHLVRSADEMKKTSIKATIGYMMGLAAAAAGSPQAGMAIASGASQVATRGFLKHTRTQEESADQAALGYMDKMGVSSKGLLDLLELLYNKENTLYDQINPYAQTHPLSKERISHVKGHLKSSQFSDNDFTPATKAAFELAIVKLNAFLDPYETTLKKYPVSDTSIKARYARAIAYYKIPNMQKSIAEIDSLIKNNPNNPFFNELKGQILFENGKVDESIVYYQKANSLLPESALLKIILATAQIASEKESMLKPAITNLEKALVKEKNNSFAWHQLAIAYGRDGDLAMSNVCLAEEAMLLENKRDTKEFIKLAKKYVKPGTTADTRLKDIIVEIDYEK